MKQDSALAAIVLGIACTLSTPASALELDGFLADVNVSARADMGAFRADLSGTFHVSGGEIDHLFKVFPDPADVFISLRIRDIANVSIERVATEYHAHKGQGWGVIAKNLGIKPGSAEFHALKQGQWTARAAGPRTAAPASPGKGQGNGKSGKNK